MENSLGLITNLSLTAWNTHVSRADKLLNELSDRQLENEVSPGRNTGVYLLGHLAAVHDAMLPLLGFGEKHHPELENIFIKNPDKSGLQKPPVSDLRNYWQKVNNALNEHFNKVTPEEWLQKHTSVSEEDFEKEPHRNRLNVLISRTNHLASHLGQLLFLNS
ncbi:MAG: DinB family protein [Ginsengibacter sp.]